MTHDDAPLFDYRAKPRKAPAGGPVYQGVAAQFRAMFPKDDAQARIRKAELAGWISLALSHARAIDHVAGATVGRAQTSSELRETLTAIAQAAGAGDAFEAFLKEISGDPTTPHTTIES